MGTALPASSIGCLFKLLNHNLINSTTVTVYLFYTQHNNERVTSTMLYKALSQNPYGPVKTLHNTAEHHRNLLGLLGLVLFSEWSGGTTGGHKGKVVRLTDEKIEAILADTDLIEKVRHFQYTRRINKRVASFDSLSHPASLERSHKASATSIHDEVRKIVPILPPKNQRFSYSSQEAKSLSELSSRLGPRKLEAYARWFVKSKMATGKIKGFGLGIFLYPGIVEEWLDTKGLLDRYRNVAAKWGQ